MPFCVATSRKVYLLSSWELNQTWGRNLQRVVKLTTNKEQMFFMAYCRKSVPTKYLTVEIICASSVLPVSPFKFGKQLPPKDGTFHFSMCASVYKLSDLLTPLGILLGLVEVLLLLLTCFRCCSTPSGHIRYSWPHSVFYATLIILL